MTMRRRDFLDILIALAIVCFLYDKFIPGSSFWFVKTDVSISYIALLSWLFAIFLFKKRPENLKAKRICVITIIVLCVISAFQFVSYLKCGEISLLIELLAVLSYIPMYITIGRNRR